MKQFSIASLIVAGFVAGCAAGMVATPLIVPPAIAGTNPTKWEYACITHEYGFREVAFPTAKLAQMGAEGWELQSIAYRNPTLVNACFKRALP